MRYIPLLFLSLALAVSFCYANDDKVVEVVGVGECADCAKNKFDTKQAFLGKSIFFLKGTMSYYLENEI